MQRNPSLQKANSDISPMPKKVDAMMHLEQPKTHKQL
jgi:hypothetical protein